MSRRLPLLVLLVLLITGCSLPGQGPDAGKAARAVATALAKGKPGSVAWDGDAGAATAAYDEVVRGLGGPDVKVSAHDVRTDGDRATATLRWDWEFGSLDWTYDAPLTLVRGTSGGEDAWLARWSPTLVSDKLAKGDRLVAQRTQARRGDILGAGGAPIVVPRPVLSVGIDKTRVPGGQAAGSARRLAGLVGIDARGFVKLVRASGPKAFVPAIVYRRGQVPAAVRSGLGAIPGGASHPGELPLAPTKDFAGAILGTVGPATAEIVKASGGRVTAGDVVGLSGLQKRYDEQLAGVSGLTISVVGEGDQAGGQVVHEVEPEPGQALRTTIEPRLQELAQSALSAVGPASALVAIHPSTGDLAAVASGPGSKGYNTATYGRYAPGSTFKVVSALALLRSGLTPSSEVSCPATTVVDGKRFKNYSDYPASGLGTISFEDALANSCNTAFIGQRDRVRGDALAQAAAALGLGVDHDTGFPSYFGSVGSPASETQRAASLIGQGTVEASPMAMATVVASVLKGSTVVPRLIASTRPAAASPGRPLKAAEARDLRQMMRAVVERGSGSRLAGLGGDVIAKTGTAEFGDTPPLPTHAWMVAGRGDLAVAVFVDRGESGSSTAGPILQKFLERAR